MNNIIYTRANLLLESFSTLCQLANPDHTPNIRYSYTGQSSPPEKQAMANKLIRYFDQVESMLKLPSDRIDFFFKEPSITVTLECRGYLFLCDCLEEENLHDFVAKVNAFDAVSRFKHIRITMARMLAQTPEVLTYMDSALSTEAILFEEIFKSADLSDQEKYDMFYIYYHYESLLEEFISLLEKTIAIIEPLLSDFEPELLALTQSLEPELNVKGMRYFSELINIDFGSNSHFRFYPCITNPLILSFTNINTSLDCFNVLFGIYVLPFIKLENHQGRTDKELGNFLKAIADPSKLQILKFLKEDRFYASQLAEKLGISNATVSHHMNALLQLEIVNFEKEQNKFYYSLEKKQLQTYLDCLNKQFDL